MANIDVDVTFDDIATLCEESQEELADLLLQEEPFYSFIKSEPSEEFGSSTEAQVENFLHCGTEVMDISHEETCCSNDCYNLENGRSPDSDGSLSHLSPDNRRKSSSSRKNRTPNTLRHIMEKHRHSERIRHHSLNEQLKAICQLVPGSAEDNRETKVVMMQRVISYIAFLENTIKFLCCELGSKPHPNWVLLTNNFRNYFRDYFKGIEDTDIGDDEVLAATENLSKSMKEQDDGHISGGRLKVSSPTVDSTTDSVVPVMVPPVEKEVTILSEDCSVPSSSVTGDEDHVAHVWKICGSQEIVSVGEAHGDAEVFFSSSVDDGVSAVLEISSSTHDNNINSPLSFGTDRTEDANGSGKAKMVSGPHEHSSTPQKPAHGYFIIRKNVVESVSKNIPRRNKRKQLSPRRSSGEEEDYLSQKAYLPSWSTGTQKTVPLHPDGDKSPCKVRALPYNIRCNHRHPVQRLQANRSKLELESPTFVQVVRPLEEPNRVATSETPDKLNSKLDLRKTSWMNGFMMFSRLNRRKFIEAHPGVHTSHISKIMGHAWRNMGREEQAPYKEKAKLCSQELYRAYTSQPEFTLFSPVSATVASSTSDASTTITPSLAVKPEPMKTD